MRRVALALPLVLVLAGCLPGGADEPVHEATPKWSVADVERAVFEEERRNPFENANPRNLKSVTCRPGGVLPGAGTSYWCSISYSAFSTPRCVAFPRGALTWVGCAERGACTPLRRPAGVERRVLDPVHGWSMTYGGRLFHYRCQYTHYPSFRETVLANFDTRAGTVLSPDSVDEFPDEGVALRIGHCAGSGCFNGTSDAFETPLPLTIGRLLRSRWWSDDRVDQREGGLVGNGWRLSVQVYSGPTASDADRAAIAGALASIRFAGLRPFTRTRSGFQVLGRAERYPVGSIVRYGPEDLDPGTESFFLVRAPGGFYAVYGTGDFGDRGYDECRLRFDRAAREFWCANGARWDIVGEVVRKPRADAPVDDLPLLRGKVSIDGYVLVGGWGIGPRHGYWPAPAA